MNSIQMNDINISPKYSKLTLNDIKREPQIFKTEVVDTFVPNSKTKQKSSLWNNIFTLSTVLLAALYIAKRTNLFNPIRREANNLLSNDDFLTKTRNKLSELFSLDDTETIIKKHLTNLSTNASKAADFKTEASSVINSTDKFSNLMKKINKKISKDNEAPESLKNGFMAQIFGSIQGDIESILKTERQTSGQIKNKADVVIEQLFRRSNNNESIMDKKIYDTVVQRYEGIVENFVLDSIIKTA